MAAKFHTGVDLNNQRGRAFADPSAATDAATKQYVDNALFGLRWKEPVRVATTTNGTLSSDFANGQTVDGVTLATGDRILLKDQTTQTENGIYIVAASGAPTRANDADSTSELHGAAVFITAGTANAEKVYTQTTDDPTIGSSNIVWVQFGGGTTYSADGQGLELSGTTFSLELDGTTLTKSASGLRIGAGAAGDGLTEASGVLAVNTGSGLEVSSDAVRIATSAAGTGLTGGGGSALSIDTSVVARKFSTTVGNGSATSFTVTHNLGTRAVTVNIFETASPYTQIFADVTHDTTNAVAVAFSSAPSSGQYTVVVVG